MMKYAPLPSLEVCFEIADLCQIVILNGVLSLNDKHAQEIMTPIADCLTLPSDKVLDHATVDQILLSGFSRIPIHEPGQRDNFIGMLLVKRASPPSFFLLWQDSRLITQL